MRHPDLVIFRIDEDHLVQFKLTKDGNLEPFGRPFHVSLDDTYSELTFSNLVLALETPTGSEELTRYDLADTSKGDEVPLIVCHQEEQLLNRLVRSMIADYVED